MTDLPKDSHVIEAALPREARVLIRIEAAELTFDEPVYAINWFDTKARWIYDLYNILASRSVVKVGGAACFKGNLVKLIHGEESDRRDVLLVVRYPSLRCFKTMLENKYFQMISVLRVLAVKKFTFGFAKSRAGGADSSLHSRQRKDGSAYGVHHFKGAATIADEIVRLCEGAAIEPFFSGALGAFICAEMKPSPEKRTPCLMDSLVILKAAGQRDLVAFINSSPYQDLVSKTQSSFIGIYDRII